MVQAEADARSGREMVVMGDDAAQLMPLVDSSAGTTLTLGSRYAPRSRRLVPPRQ